MNAKYVSHKKLYLTIFVILALLTFVELFIPEMDMSQLLKGILLTVIAIVKAGFVGWYFMHLNEERPWLKFIAMIPVSAFLFAYVLVIESMYR